MSIPYLDPAKALYGDDDKLGAEGEYAAAVEKYLTGTRGADLPTTYTTSARSKTFLNHWSGHSFEDPRSKHNDRPC